MVSWSAFEANVAAGAVAAGHASGNVGGHPLIRALQAKVSLAAEPPWSPYATSTRSVVLNRKSPAGPKASSWM